MIQLRQSHGPVWGFFYGRVKMVFEYTSGIRTKNELEPYVLRLEKEIERCEKKGIYKRERAEALFNKMEEENTRSLIVSIFESLNETKNLAYLDLYRRIKSCFKQTDVEEAFEDYARIAREFFINSPDPSIYIQHIKNLTNEVVYKGKHYTVEEIHKHIFEARVISDLLIDYSIDPIYINIESQERKITKEKVLEEKIENIIA